MPDTVCSQDFLDCVADLQSGIDQLKGRPFSDLQDAEGHQYVDLVLEGGGTLGVALLGYIHVLEEVGLRFIGLGGTSAGAVTAIALGAAGTPREARLARLLEELANLPLKDFVDGRKAGDRDALNFLQSWTSSHGSTVARWMSRIWQGGQVLDNLTTLHALNRGEVFLAWMDGLLRSFNQGQPLNVGTLRQRMNDLPELQVSPAADPDDFAHLPRKLWADTAAGRRYLPASRPDQLCVVATDISTETKVAFPRMAQLYWDDPDQVNVALFARASMSIPGFFATFQVPSLPADRARPRWQEATAWPARCFEGDFLPATHHFVDGAVLSNFPIDAFHNPVRVPLRPTLGVKLQWDEHRHDIHGLMDVLGQSFSTARQVLDSEFIAKHPDYSKLVAYIDTLDIGWLDFAMSKANKLRLFRMGAEAAVQFLQGFDWQDYKRIRRLLLEAGTTQI